MAEFPTSCTSGMCPLHSLPDGHCMCMLIITTASNGFPCKDWLPLPASCLHCILLGGRILMAGVREGKANKASSSPSLFSNLPSPCTCTRKRTCILSLHGCICLFRPQGEGLHQLREALKILAERVLILETVIGLHGE